MNPADLDKRRAAGITGMNRIKGANPKRCGMIRHRLFWTRSRTGMLNSATMRSLPRLMIPMCVETVRCVEENVVESAAAADMGLIWGVGFPPFRGGPLRFIDNMGVDVFCDLADSYASLGNAYQVTEGLARHGGRRTAFLCIDSIRKRNDL